MSSASSISTNSLKPYSTITDVPHGLNIVTNWDSSVASAPAPFIAVVEQVADFYTSALQPIFSGPITIDVGCGEINGSRLGGSALGESETNLQQVSYYQLTHAYATYDSIVKTDLSQNFPSTQPSGKFYVSDAERQALGIITTPPTLDGYVAFRSKSNIFDYSTSGTVPSSQYDISQPSAKAGEKQWPRKTKVRKRQRSLRRR